VKINELQEEWSLILKHKYYYKTLET